MLCGILSAKVYFFGGSLDLKFPRRLNYQRERTPTVNCFLSSDIKDLDRTDLRIGVGVSTYSDQEGSKVSYVGLCTGSSTLRFACRIAFARQVKSRRKIK